MAAKTKLINTVDSIISCAKEEKIIHLSSSGKHLRENTLTLDGQKTLNFGSCSYLGLEFDDAVLEASKDAIDIYGSQFSSSRAYVSVELYDSLEQKFSEIFGGECIVSPTTTLGHIAAIPVLIKDGDAIILDHQAHNSIHMAVDMLASRDVKVVLAKHNDMAFVEEQIRELRKDHQNIWYLADGVYSMFGDACPVHKVMELMDKYPELHFYVDDAHGMSCFGEKGQGYVLTEIKMRDRMVVTASLAKAFATGGAVLIFPNSELKNRVRNCGGPMITSGPLQPAVLGAANKVADYHLSGHLITYQETLRDNVLYTNLMLKENNLPLVAENESPIFFVGTGKPVIAQRVIKEMIERGFFLNLGVFPAVPIKRAGIRFTITANMSFEQIRDMINNLGEVYMRILHEENYSLEIVHSLFNLEKPVVETPECEQTDYDLSRYTTIKMIDRGTWNEHFSGQSMLTWETLRMMEETFGNEFSGPGNKWDFEYLVVKDQSEQILLMAICTVMVTKDDMLLSAEVSRVIEEKRLEDPTYLTSRTVMLGTPLTEGQQFFIDKSRKDQKRLLSIMSDWTDTIRMRYEAGSVIMRDFIKGDREMTSFLQDQGYFMFEMPPSYFIDDFDFETKEEFVNKLSKRSKKHFKQDVRRHEDKFVCEIKQTVDERELGEFYELYKNVHNKSLDVNTFVLPYTFFSAINSNPEWEFIVLYTESKEVEGFMIPVSVAFTHTNAEVYNFPIVGVDYNYQNDIKCYQQILFRVYLRAKELKAVRCNWGFTADTEKRKFGAKKQETCCFVQQNDTFKMQFIDSLEKMSKE